jgi:hypothetical protein
VPLHSDTVALSMFNARTSDKPGTQVRLKGSDKTGEVIGFNDPMVTVEVTHPAGEGRSQAVATEAIYHQDLLEVIPVVIEFPSGAQEEITQAPRRGRARRADTTEPAQ